MVGGRSGLLSLCPLTVTLSAASLVGEHLLCWSSGHSHRQWWEVGQGCSHAAILTPPLAAVSSEGLCFCLHWCLHDLKQLCSQHLILGVSLSPSFRPVIFGKFFYVYVLSWFRSLIGFWWLCILSCKFRKYRVFIMCCELYWFVQKVWSGFSLGCHTQKNFLANPILNNL